MATKKNTIGLANNAASLIIREIGEKHFRQPPYGAFTINDMMRHYPDAGKEAVRGRLERMLTCGELSAGIFNRKKYYWKA